MSDTTPILQEELVEMFGDSMPMEAVTLLFGSPPEMTVGEIRATLRKIARERKGRREVPV